MSDELVLYDLANRNNVSWSANPWKTRLLLNLKRIPYRTEWVEYPELEPNFKALGIPPNEPPVFAKYSSPTIRLPDGSYVMDSVKIAEKLESLYPSPSLHMETGLHQQAAQLCSATLFTVVPEYMAPVVDEWLQEPSKSWFAADRERRFGMTVWELRERKGGDQTWPATEAKLKALQALLRDHKRDDGPFVLGATVSYADLVIIALFESFGRTQKEVYERVVGYDEAFRTLHETGKQWTEKDD